jgi:hypothetical protein
MKAPLTASIAAANTLPPGRAVPALMMPGAGPGALTFPSVPSPENYQRGALEKVLLSWGAFSEFSSKAAEKQDGQAVNIYDVDGQVICWIPDGGWKAAIAGKLKVCYKDIISKLSGGIIGPHTIYNQRRQMKEGDIPTAVKIGCGCLATRTDSSLPDDATSCMYGAHWDIRAAAGVHGVEVAPAKASLKVSAGQWFAAYQTMHAHFVAVLPTAEKRLGDFDPAGITASSFDPIATTV